MAHLPTLIGEAFAVFVKENKVLLSLRQNTGYLDNHWGLVAGHVEAGESFREGCLREIQEEVGVNIELGDLEFVNIMHRSCEKDKPQRISCVFVIKKRSGTLINKEPKKCGGVEWFDIDELPETTIPHVREMIDSYKNKLYYKDGGFSTSSIPGD